MELHLPLIRLKLNYYYDSMHIAKVNWLRYLHIYVLSLRKVRHRCLNMCCYNIAYLRISVSFVSS